jgi:hypothetical protein
MLEDLRLFHPELLHQVRPGLYWWWRTCSQGNALVPTL